MIELKYEVVRNQPFHQALAKLLHYPRFALGTAKAVARIVQGVREAGDAAQGRFEAVVKAHAFLDEQGEILPNEGVKGTFKIVPEKFADFEKAIAAMEEETFFVDAPHLFEEQLGSIELSPNELILLEPLFDSYVEDPAATPQLALAEAPALL